jgi:hypothetical protein
MRSEKRLLGCTRQIATCKQSSQVDLQHHGGRRPVLPCVEDSVRRPQRPGNQARAEARSWRNPPSHSPSESLGTAGSAAMLWQGTQNISLDVSHSAPATLSHQAKTQAPLCRNCGCRRFLVEARGKYGPFLDLSVLGPSHAAGANGYPCVILRRNPCARCTNPVRGKNMNGQCPSTTCIPFCLQNATASSLTAPVPPAR